MEQIIIEQLKGFQIKFRTQPGVFSKKGLDSGTKLLIENLEVKDQTLIADLGSGSGVIGFVAAKLNPNGHVHLLDDHLRSVELAKSNLLLNKLTNVEIYLSDLFSAVSERTYDQIFSNPPQQLGNEFLEELIGESFKHLKPQGELWLVVKNNLKSVVERAMKERFRKLKVITQNREYTVLSGKKD